MGVQVSSVKKCKNAKVQVRIKSVDTGKVHLVRICLIYIVYSSNFYCLGTQTDFEESVERNNAGVQCEIGHFGFQRSSTPDIEPIQRMSMTDEESINYNEEASESMYEEPKPKAVIVE